MKGWPLNFLLNLYMASFLLAGCSSSYVMVQPTTDELNAVRSIQKTVVIMPFSEDGTQILGVGPTIEHKLAGYLDSHFRIIDPALVQATLAADKPPLTDDKRIAQIGANLGADYVLLGNVMVTVKGPEIRYSTCENKENEFSAKVWAETTGRTDLAIKMLSTADGDVVFADDFWGTDTDTSDVVEFNNLSQYNKAVDAAKIAEEFKHGVEVLANLKDKHHGLIEASMEPALKLVQKNLRDFRAYSGEVLEIVSEKEILVNLGSAYGLRPRDMLSVWREGPPVTDPRTGRSIVSKERLGFVKIQRITSGLSCVAKGKEKQVRKMQAGNKVFIK